MTSMREKIAEIIRLHTTDVAWTPEGMADAVLDALMEPTEGMLGTCWPLHHPWGQNAPLPAERQSIFDEVATKVKADWQAMITAAKEGK